MKIQKMEQYCWMCFIYFYDKLNLSMTADFPANQPSVNNVMHWLWKCATLQVQWVLYSVETISLKTRIDADIYYIQSQNIICFDKGYSHLLHELILLKIRFLYIGALCNPHVVKQTNKSASFKRISFTWQAFMRK